MYRLSDLDAKDKKTFEKVNKYVCDSAVIARLTKDFVSQHIDDAEFKDLVETRINSSTVGNLLALLRTPTRPIPHCAESYSGVSRQWTISCQGKVS